jgi:hypothetical protein
MDAGGLVLLGVHVQSAEVVHTGWGLNGELEGLITKTGQGDGKPEDLHVCS